jgi:hypothetical protein
LLESVSPATSFRRRFFDLASIGAPKLQCAIGDAKAARGALKIPMLLVGCVANGDILGCAANLLEPSAEEDSAPYRPLEI